MTQKTTFKISGMNCGSCAKLIKIGLEEQKGVKNVDVNFEKYNNILEQQKGRGLYEHQEAGIKFLLARKGCILADDMGLGKTI